MPYAVPRDNMWIFKKTFFKYVCVRVCMHVCDMYMVMWVQVPQRPEASGSPGDRTTVDCESPATNAWSQAGVLCKSSVQL